MRLKIDQISPLFPERILLSATSKAMTININIFANDRGPRLAQPGIIQERSPRHVCLRGLVRFSVFVRLNP